MNRRRIAVTLLFTAAGITSLAVVPLAWGGQGFTATTQATVTGRAASSFPVAATSVPATASSAATAPQIVQPPAASVPMEAAPVGAEPAGEAAGKSKNPRPSRTRKPSTPADLPSDRPSTAPSTSESTGN